MKKSAAKVTKKTSKSKRILRTNRISILPFYTLLFIVGALVLTLLAVQQPQNLIQNAAEKKPADCISPSPSTNAKRDARQATRAAEKPTRAEPTDSSDQNRVDRQATKAARKESPAPCTSDKSNRTKAEKQARKEARQNKKTTTTSSGGSLVCRFLPNLPFCSGTASRQTGNCDTTNGSGKNGSASSSNSDGNVTIGKINTDGSTNTNITVNGKPYSSGDEITGSPTTSYQEGEDINTGGKQGESSETTIRIEKNGGNEYDDQSGGNNTQPMKKGNCERKPVNNNDQNNDLKKADNTTSDRNSGTAASFICRIFPAMRSCSR